MNDYIIHAKLKNNNILSRILEKNRNVNQFCRDHGLHATDVGKYINLRRSAISADTGKWMPSAIALADALGVLPDELFVEEQKTVALKTNEAYVEMYRPQALNIADGTEGVERHIDMKRISTLLLDYLPPRHRKVLEMRMHCDMTFDETAEALGVTRERIRQIEENALRKIRGYLGERPILRAECLALAMEE